MMFTRVLIPLALYCFSQIAYAHDVTEHYDHISLSASASKEVNQDELQLTLYALSESEDARSSVTEVSNRINQALALLNAQSAIKVQTGGFTTHPVYHKQQIKGWRSRQSLIVKSRDTALLSQLLAQLMPYVQLENMQYEISENIRRQVENDLIATAIKNFQQRAVLITSSLGRQKYRVVDLNISTSQPRPQLLQARTMSVRAEAAAPPAIQPGTRQVQVNVNGKIEVQPNN